MSDERFVPEAYLVRAPHCCVKVIIRGHVAAWYHGEDAKQEAINYIRSFSSQVYEWDGRNDCFHVVSL